jgi:hypothetical protein
MSKPKFDPVEYKRRLEIKMKNKQQQSIVPMIPIVSVRNVYQGNGKVSYKSLPHAITLANEKIDVPRGNTL